MPANLENSVVVTGLKSQFSFQSQRKAMPKNVQTTVQLHSTHMLANLCSKSFQKGFSSTLTKNFQMYKLSFKEAEEPEIKLSKFDGSWRKQGSSRKISTSALLTSPKVFDCVDHNQLWKIQEMGTPQYLTCLLRNLCGGQETTVRTVH